MKLSVIIPFVQEWPQIAFTIRSMHEELSGIDHEIVAIDNYCREVENQGQIPDRGHDHYTKDKKRLKYFDEREYNQAGVAYSAGHIAAQATMHDWLTCVQYRDKLSHWNAKNLGVEHSTGDVLLFVDSHVVPSCCSLDYAWALMRYMANSKDHENDTLHLPLTYHILEQKRLVYKLIFDSEKGVAHYSFTGFSAPEQYHPLDIDTEKDFNMYTTEVPCMSTCGMMMTRKLFDKLGGWPEGMGIYGGGENFINFCIATFGGRKFISNFGALHHHGDKRNYHFNWTDYHINRMIATNCYGGSDWLERYRIALGGEHNNGTKNMANTALKVSDQHAKSLRSHQVTNLDEWAKKWTGR